MNDRNTLTATVIGNPDGGKDNVDGAAEDVPSYQVAPVEQAKDGPIGPESDTPQGMVPDDPSSC